MKRKPRQKKKRFHEKHALPLFCIILAVALGISAIFVNKHFSNAQTSDIKPAGPYIDVFWPDEDYTSREWEFTPLTESPEGYFWAFQQGFVDGEGFYVGMQHPTEGKEKLLLFSVWSALGASADSTDGGWCQTFGGEGEGYSCRRYYDWVVGRTYAFRVAKVSEGWWGAWMKDTVTGEEIYFGKIQVPQAWGGLSDWSVMWTEYFGNAQLGTCEDLPYAKGKWGKTVSDATEAPEEIVLRVTDNSCKGNTKNTPDKDGYIQEMGIAAKSGGLNAAYYTLQDFSGKSMNRIDETVNFFSWDTDLQYTSVRWEGEIFVPTAGEYTFTTNTAGSVRLWIDNQLLIDAKGGSEPIVQNGTISLQKGTKYPLRMDYVKNRDQKQADLRWSGPGIAMVRIPQYHLIPNGGSIPLSVDAISQKISSSPRKSDEKKASIPFISDVQKFMEYLGDMLQMGFLGKKEN
jgi:hypothetical protein